MLQGGTVKSSEDNLGATHRAGSPVALPAFARTPAQSTRGSLSGTHRTLPGYDVTPTAKPPADITPMAKPPAAITPTAKPPADTHAEHREKSVPSTRNLLQGAPTPTRTINFFQQPTDIAELSADKISEIKVGETSFAIGQTCLYGDGVQKNEHVLRALKEQSQKYHQATGSPVSSWGTSSTVHLCGKCLGLSAGDGPCSFALPHDDVKLVYKDELYAVGEVSGDIAKCAVYIMGWTLNFEGDTVLDDEGEVDSPIFVVWYKDQPSAAFTLPDTAPKPGQRGAARSFLEAMAVLQRPAGFSGSSVVRFIVGIAEAKGYFGGGPAWPSTSFFPPGWALLMSAIRSTLPPIDCSAESLLKSYFHCALLNASQAPALMNRFAFFDTLLRWPPKQEDKSNPFKAECLLKDELGAADTDDVEDDAWQLGFSASHEDAVHGANAMAKGDVERSVFALSGMVLGLKNPVHFLTSSPELQRDVQSVLGNALAEAKKDLRKLDPNGSFLETDDSRMEKVWELHATLQYVMLAAVHLLAHSAQLEAEELPLGSKPPPSGLHRSSWKAPTSKPKLQETAWGLVNDALVVSLEILPGIVDELSPWTQGYRAAFGWLGWTRLPADRKGLAALRKAQMHSSMWGAAAFLHKAVRPKIMRSTVKLDWKVPKTLYQMLNATDPLLKGELPASELPQKRLAMLAQALKA